MLLTCCVLHKGSQWSSQDFQKQSECKLNHINEVGTSVHDKMCHYTNHVLL